MKKKSILLTCIAAVMALAMFVGCDNAPVYPSFPTSGFVAQIGDFVEGQSFDASKFQVIATYLDGSKKVIEDASVLYTDTDKDNKLSTGDTVSAIVGFDYNNNQLKGEGTVTVYPVEHYEVTAAEKTYTVGDVSSADLSVTAYYINGKGELANMQVSASDAGLTASVSRDAETTGTMTVSNGRNVIAEIEVTVEEEVVEPFVKIASIEYKAGSLAQYDYAEPIEFTFDDFVVKAYRANVDQTPDQAVTVENAEDLPGFEVKAVRGDGLDMQSSDWAFKSQTRTSLKVVASFNGTTAEGSIKVVKPVITVAYRGEGIVEGTKLADVVLDPADFFITEKVSGRTPATVQLDAKDATFTFVNGMGTPYAEDAVMPEYNKEAANNGQVHVKTIYNGYEGNDVVIDALSANYAKEITGMQVTLVDGYSIAKQQYTTDINDTLTTAVIKSITATQDGKTIEINPADVTVKYSTSNAKYEALKDGKNLTSVDTLYILVSYEYGGKNPVEKYVEVKTIAPVATGIELTATFTNDAGATAAMVGSTINWNLTATTEDGYFHYLGTYRVYINNVLQDALPGTVEETEIGDVAVVINTPDGTASSKVVNIPAGKGYVTVDDLKVAVKDGVYPLIGSAMRALSADDFEVTAGTFDVEGNATNPVVTEIVLDYPSMLVKKANTVTAVVSYAAKDGTTKTKDVSVAVSGYENAVVDSNIRLALTGKVLADNKIENGASGNLAIAEGTYVNNGDTPVIKEIKTKYGLTVSATNFKADGNVAPYTVTYEYISGYSETGEPVKSTGTISLEVVAAQN